MLFQILLISFHQVALGDSPREVHGYLGDTVTLPSGASSSWNLSSIDWSISSNTWIATYHSGKINLERVNRYKGRLSLNIASGDLMIHKLTREDDMEYTVDLINTEGQDSVNKIRLVVRQRLQEPTIQTFPCTYPGGGCCIWLNCSSTDEGVDFSWQVKPASGTVFNTSNPDDNFALLFAFLNTTQHHFEFTCTSHRRMEVISSVVTHKCEVSDDKPGVGRSRYATVFVSGGFVGILLTVLSIIIICCRVNVPSQNSA